MRSLLLTAFVAVLLAAPAHAFLGDKNKEDSRPAAPTPSAAMPPRQQAETWYADAYDEVAKANKDLADGNTKGAEKKFKKARDRALRATEADTSYHEAWNLVGYANRKLGKYDEALAAYARCLRLKPDYAPAHEYLGEAELELGHVDKAKEHLAVLDRMGEERPAQTLRDAIAAWEKAHPAPGGSN